MTVKSEKIVINEDVFYIKPDKNDGYYYLGCAPVVYVIKDGEMIKKGSFSESEIDGLCVYVKEDDNGKKNYMLVLNKGEFTRDMNKYILGMVLITNDKSLNGGSLA